MLPCLSLLFLGSLLSAAAVAQSPATGSWPQFRGPRGVAEAAMMPRSLDLAPGEESWVVDLPAGKSSPCVVGNRIFVTGRDEGSLVMLCLDRADGSQVWRHDVPAPDDETDYRHEDAGIAQPTPCSDGERVCFYFATHGVVVFSLDGEKLWEKRMDDPRAAFGVGGSPLIVDDSLVVVRDGCDGPDSAIHCFDLETGETRWAVSRVPSYQTHCTPFLWENAERRELVVASTGRIVGLDPTTGEEFWSVGGVSGLVCTSLTADRERLYYAAWSTGSSSKRDLLESSGFEPMEFSDEEVEDPKLSFARFDVDANGVIELAELPDGRLKSAFDDLDPDHDGALDLEEWTGLQSFPRRGENVALAIRAGGDGEIGETHVLWRYKRVVPYVSSPVLASGKLWLVKAGGLVSVLDAKTGEPLVRRKRLSDHSEYYSSPVALPDGRVIVCADAGTLYVLDASGKALEVDHEAEFGDHFAATPAIVDGTVYLRTEHKLWAFGG